MSQAGTITISKRIAPLLVITLILAQTTAATPAIAELSQPAPAVPRSFCTAMPVDGSLPAATLPAVEQASTVPQRATSPLEKEGCEKGEQISISEPGLTKSAADSPLEQQPPAESTSQPGQPLPAQTAERSSDNNAPASDSYKKIRLEATVIRSITLRDALSAALQNNLAINISKAELDSKKWTYLSSLGRNLPDLLVNYRQQLYANNIYLGGPEPTRFHTPNSVVSATLRYYAFQGGQIHYQARSDLHQKDAARENLHGVLADVLLEIARCYYLAVLGQSCHQIRMQAIEAAQAEIAMNMQREKDGFGTKFNILQSKMQLARDEHALLGEEVTQRAASMKLAAALGIDPGINYLPVDSEVKKVTLVDPRLDIQQLVALAMKNRPELARDEFARLAARDKMKAVSGSVLPSLQLFSSYNAMSPYSNTLLGPLGSLPGTVFLPGQRLTQKIGNSFAAGLQVNWSLLSLGAPDMARMRAEKANARAAMLKAHQQVLNVLTEVRQAYLASVSAEEQIDVAAREVALAKEQVRLAKMRLENGLGSNLELIQAERDLTNASMDRAQSIIEFNIAQAQLLHDTGLISVDSITSGTLSPGTDAAYNSDPTM